MAAKRERRVSGITRAKIAAYLREGGIHILMRKLILTAALASFLVSGCAGSESADIKTREGAPRVVISFNYKKQSGYASNQFAIWIEDLSGEMVKTLYATRFTAKGGYKTRPESLRIWAEKFGLASKGKKEVDAITGATPESGELSYIWDLTDERGNPAPAGDYRFVAEGSLRWSSRVIHTGEITVGGDTEREAEAGAEYAFNPGEDGGPPLSGDSDETGMLTEVKAVFTPGKEAYEP
jgi:hypothetical protein